MNVYIFGMGKGKSYLDRCLLPGVHVCGYIDNYKAEKMDFWEGIPVIRQNELKERYDYIIITLMQYAEVKDALIADGVKKEKIISFFDMRDASAEGHWKVIDGYKWRTELMWRDYTSVTIPSIENMHYELYADKEAVKRDCPRIAGVEETAEVLQRERKCLARFGDNEFELMSGRLRTNYQDVDLKLAERLKEVLYSQEDNLMAAIADNYGSLENYTDEAARDIRMYMTKEVRKSHMELLEPDRLYYNAYLSRPYMIYRDKRNAKQKFEQIKKIWEGIEVLIVEGEHTRFGVGNDLLKNAKSIERILAPDKNAFDRYDEIKNAVIRYGKGKLVLAVLGPTATVLAYDLAREKYWAVDIGQLDVEYEWFLLGVNKRCDLKYKTVSEVISYDEKDAESRDSDIERYKGEIITKIL